MHALTGVPGGQRPPGAPFQPPPRRGSREKTWNYTDSISPLRNRDFASCILTSPLLTLLSQNGRHGRSPHSSNAWAKTKSPARWKIRNGPKELQNESRVPSRTAREAPKFRTRRTSAHARATPQRAVARFDPKTIEFEAWVHRILKQGASLKGKAPPFPSGKRSPRLSSRNEPISIRPNLTLRHRPFGPLPICA